MDFVRETPLSHGQVVDFEQLIRETPPVYGQTEHLESTIFRNKSSEVRMAVIAMIVKPSSGMDRLSQSP